MGGAAVAAVAAALSGFLGKALAGRKGQGPGRSRFRLRCGESPGGPGRASPPGTGLAWEDARRARVGVPGACAPAWEVPACRAQPAPPAPSPHPGDPAPAPRALAELPAGGTPGAPPRAGSMGARPAALGLRDRGPRPRRRSRRIYSLAVIAAQAERPGSRRLLRFFSRG